MELKEEIKKGFGLGIGADEEEEDEFLSIRPKSSEEKKAEEESYRLFLKENLEKDKSGAKFFESLSKDANEEDSFLLNYVMNRGWMDREIQRIPTYDEVVDDEDNQNDEKIDQFEESYNFRYEEP